jgi:hypothetical protein
MMNDLSLEISNRMQYIYRLLISSKLKQAPRNIVLQRAIGPPNFARVGVTKTSRSFYAADNLIIVAVLEGYIVRAANLHGSIIVGQEKQLLHCSIDENIVPEIEGVVSKDDKSFVLFARGDGEVVHGRWIGIIVPVPDK